MAKFFVFIILLLFSSINSYALETADSADLSIKKISELIGYKGEYNANTKIYKIIVPRNDLKVAMRGMQITPDMGLVSWIEFKKTGDVTSIKGDLLLLQDQVNPVMSVALTNGLQVMRLRNPYLWDSPRVTLMHLKGEGNELKLAKAVKQLFDKIKMTTNEENDFPLGTSDLLETTLNPRKIDAILGVHAQFKNGVYRVEFSEKINSTQEDFSKEILKNSWATFSGSDTDTVMEGSLVLPESELQKVLLKLRHEQFYVLAIYQHVVDDVKGYVFISFWGMGDIKKLAGALHDIFLVAQSTASISASPTESAANALNKPAVSPSLQLSLEQARSEWNVNVNVKETGELRLKVFTLLGLA
ncbi:MAG: LppY/LpqO family protein, partial [Gammaproteobacteria bacterium]|nr:LppY/LpqO family protein [Gammaproteobacteria bacterium]